MSRDTSNIPVPVQISNTWAGLCLLFFFFTLIAQIFCECLWSIEKECSCENQYGIESSINR